MNARLIPARMVLLVPMVSIHILVIALLDTREANVRQISMNARRTQREIIEKIGIWVGHFQVGHIIVN